MKKARKNDNRCKYFTSEDYLLSRKPPKLLVVGHRLLTSITNFIPLYACITVPTFVDIDSCCQPATDTCFLRVDCISITRHGEWPVIKFIHKWPWCNWTRRTNESPCVIHATRITPLRITFPYIFIWDCFYDSHISHSHVFKVHSHRGRV